MLIQFIQSKVESRLRCAVSDYKVFQKTSALRWSIDFCFTFTTTAASLGIKQYPADEPCAVVILFFTFCLHKACMLTATTKHIFILYFTYTKVVCINVRILCAYNIISVVIGKQKLVSL